MDTDWNTQGKDEGASISAISVTRFRRSVTAISGIYYRLDKGVSGGRNSRSTDATLAAHVRTCRELLAAEMNDEDSPLYAYLESHPKLADKWYALERRYYGLPA